MLLGILECPYPLHKAQVSLHQDNQRRQRGERGRLASYTVMLSSHKQACKEASTKEKWFDPAGKDDSRIPTFTHPLTERFRYARSYNCSESQKKVIETFPLPASTPLTMLEIMSSWVAPFSMGHNFAMGEQGLR